MIAGGEINQAAWNLLLANVRTSQERAGDLWAQIAANQRGQKRLQELVTEHGIQKVHQYMSAMLDYTERMTRSLLNSIPDGEYTFSDHMDNNGIDNHPVQIKVTINIEDEQAIVDFSGSAHSF